ncbi:MAG: SMP-30/gluconolactonase/LRE family protein [Pedosphaera sp.]|nr:SMP-30/gluconolactonase/LRE family protein [Pedosphaera sp.]
MSSALKKTAVSALIFLSCFTACQSPSPAPRVVSSTYPISNVPPNYAPTNATGTLGTLWRMDPALDLLIAPGARIEKLAQGFDWTEGPVWISKGNYLLFSDIPPNRVYRWDAATGLKSFLFPSGYTGRNPRTGEVGSNGLLLDSQGRLVLCQHGDRRVARLDSTLEQPNSTYATLADKFNGRRLNSPNDACFHKNGDLYFTDPPYGLEKNVADPAKELPHQGVYRLAKDGTVTLLTDKMTRPNGIAFSPDQRTLYVANSDPNRAYWMAFEVLDDGKLGKGRVLFDSTPFVKKGMKGLPDGMKVDQSGNLFATGPGGVLVLDPAGKHLGTIHTGEATANCTWGEDGTVLYITADMYLCRIKTKTKGVGF